MCILWLHSTVAKIPTFTKFNKNPVNYIYIYIFQTCFKCLLFNYMLLKQIHTHCFNIIVICRELMFLENQTFTFFDTSLITMIITS